MSAASPALLAHQGGWDEILLIAGPIVLIMGLLWLAKRRVDHIDRGYDDLVGRLAAVGAHIERR